MTRPFLPLIGALLVLMVAVPPASALDPHRPPFRPPFSVLPPVCADTTVPPEDMPPGFQIGAHCGPAKLGVGLDGVSVDGYDGYLLVGLDCPLPTPIAGKCPEFMLFMRL